jgi:hypothetical protein
MKKMMKTNPHEWLLRAIDLDQHVHKRESPVAFMACPCPPLPAILEVVREICRHSTLDTSTSASASASALRSCSIFFFSALLSENENEKPRRCRREFYASVLCNDL